ncbi:MAG: aspartate kinase [Myxococcota bacterium]|jgi:aspartate kinase
MRVIVHKYGGSSVSTLLKVQRVADRVAACVADGTRLAVVVSAMGNTTNELLGLAREISPSPARRELDMLLSVGERVTMALLAMALRERGVDAVSLTGSQSGIITDESHADARVVEVRPARVLAHLERGQVVIVAGFQGVSRDREVTTLGRGGSDTTAVVLAAALGAEFCEICSDVDGVWSADPRLVPSARRRDTLSLDEALALSRGGAKVLFEDAVRYARDHGVHIQTSSTFGPGSGTRLRTEPSVRRGAASVTGDAQLVRLDLATADAPTPPSARAGGLRVRRRVGATLYLDVRNAHGPPTGVPTALVTAAGSGLGERAHEVDVASAALGATQIRVRAHGHEADTAWWEVAPAQIDLAVGVVHGALVRDQD